MPGNVEQGMKFMTRVKDCALDVSFVGGDGTRIPLTDTQFLMFMKCLGLEVTGENSISFYDDASLLKFMNDKRFRSLFCSKE